MKKSLGKGLDSLIRSNNKPDPLSKIDNSELFITDLMPNPNQPRKNFDFDLINDLADSIKEHGLIQPISVIDNKDGKYIIVAGERRWRASQVIGLKKVPVNILSSDDQNTFELALVENIQREDLNPIETAKAIKKLINDYNFSNDQILKITGKKRASIINTLRILELPNQVIDLIIDNKLTRGHAIALLSFEDESKIIEISQNIISDGLSVREVEKLARKSKKENFKRNSNQNDIYLDGIRNDLENKIGLTVNIKGGSKSGKVEIKFNSLEELNNLIKFFKK